MTALALSALYGPCAHENRDLERQRHPRAPSRGRDAGSPPSSPTSCACRRSRRRPSKSRAALRELAGYWCYWHGGAKGYSGVALHVAKSLTRNSGARLVIRISPRSSTRARASPPRRRACRRRRAAVGVGLRAQRRQGPRPPRCGSSTRSSVRGGVGARCRADRPSPGPVRRSQCRARRDRRPPQGAQARARSASCREERELLRAAARPRARRRRARARSRQRPALHLVGALAQPAPAQHRLAHRLRAGQRRAGRARVSCVVHREFGTSDHARRRAVRGTIIMGTLRGFPNPPATDSAGHPPPSTMTGLRRRCASAALLRAPVLSGVCAFSSAGPSFFQNSRDSVFASALPNRAPTSAQHFTRRRPRSGSSASAASCASSRSQVTNAARR